MQCTFLYSVHITWFLIFLPLGTIVDYTIIHQNRIHLCVISISLMSCTQLCCRTESTDPASSSSLNSRWLFPRYSEIVGLMGTRHNVFPISEFIFELSHINIRVHPSISILHSLNDLQSIRSITKIAKSFEKSPLSNVVFNLI